MHVEVTKKREGITKLFFEEAKMAFFPVSIKESNGRNNYMINVGTNWNVAEVKQALLAQSGLQPNQFKLVFAGQELKDTMTLEVHSVNITHYSLE